MAEAESFEFISLAFYFHSLTQIFFRLGHEWLDDCCSRDSVLEPREGSQIVSLIVTGYADPFTRY